MCHRIFDDDNTNNIIYKYKYIYNIYASRYAGTRIFEI